MRRSFRGKTRWTLRILLVAVLFVLGMAMTTVVYAEDTADGGETPSAAGALHDGFFVGNGDGKYGKVTLSVQVKDGKIETIRVLAKNETPKYWEKAKATFLAILQEQKPEVDNISGATKSSRAIREATRSALNNSRENLGNGDPSAPRSDLFAGGKGTEEEPFLIDNVSQLVKFRQSVTDAVDYQGIHVRLEKDLDLSGIAWEPVGEAGCSFEGYFDGQGHTISGMRLGTKGAPLNPTRKQPAYGFFGVLGASAVVRDLQLKDVQINVSGDQTLYVGSVAGLCRMAPNTPDIEEYSLTEKERVAGAGCAISGCQASGEIRANAGGQNVWAGGLVGRGENLQIKDCRESCLVEAVTSGYFLYVGGLLGQGEGGSITSSECAGTVASHEGSSDTVVYSGEISGAFTGEQGEVRIIRPPSPEKAGENKPAAKKPAPKKKVVPAALGKPSLGKSKLKKRKCTLRWKLIAGASGYIIETAKDRGFHKGKKTIRCKSGKIVKKKIKLKKGQHFVRIRAYKTVRGKAIQYSAFSNTLRV